jgi:hypothetical protein
MMDHETRPRMSLLDRLVKAIRPSPPSMMGPADMAEPAINAGAIDGDHAGMMAGAPSMSDLAPMDAPSMDTPSMDTPSMDTPSMAESAVELSAMDDPAATDGPSMG